MKEAFGVRMKEALACPTGCFVEVLLPVDEAIFHLATKSSTAVTNLAPTPRGFVTAVEDLVA